MMFGSRAFTSQMLWPTKHVQQAWTAPITRNHQSSSRAVSPFYAPLLDILNHKPGAGVEWQPRCGYVGLQVLEKYEAGEEIYDNYGPRDKERCKAPFTASICRILRFARSSAFARSLTKSQSSIVKYVID
jgi:hypothetical protein